METVLLLAFLVLVAPFLLGFVFWLAYNAVNWCIYFVRRGNN